jgi:hypothetical protein
MPSSLHYSRRMLRVPGQKLAVLAMICLVYFLGVLPSASAQTHYGNHGTTHYRSVGHAHSFDQKTHSVPSSVAPEMLGKSSGGAVRSRNKELDQLERASVAKSMSVKSGARSVQTKNALAPNQHSAPINFTHKELSQSHAPAQRRPTKR